MKMNNLNDWLSYIETLHGQEIELGLERVSQVFERLEIDFQSSKVITVAGTNGKGSTVALVEALARKCRYSVGVYCSPHVRCFAERIRVDGQLADEHRLVQAFHKVEEARQAIELTYFEFVTLAALYYFASLAPEIIVLEVGLGGRLDAVNIVEPDVALITTVDFDHMQWLGEDLPSIAREKAGIFRQTSHNLVGDEKTKHLLDKVSPELDYQLAKMPDGVPSWGLLQKSNPQGLLPQHIALALNSLQACGLDMEQLLLHLPQALQSLFLPGRWQRLDWECPVIVDVAHNEQAVSNLLRRWAAQDRIGKAIGICGIMKDKSVRNVLSICRDHFDELVFVDLPTERAEKAEQLYRQAQSLGLDKISKDESVAAALQRLRGQVSNKDMILVFGSFFTVADLLQYLESDAHSDER